MSRFTIFKMKEANKRKIKETDEEAEALRKKDASR